jgi:alpha-tubulin suppressor-like RCC1 family protein
MAHGEASMTHVVRTVFTCGCGFDGRLGHNDEKNLSRLKRISRTDSETYGEIQSIHVGGYHSFVRCERAVLAFGCNDDGQLGLGDRTSRKVPTPVDFFKNPQDIVRIECGSKYSAVLMRDGSIHTTGSNDCGQLGLGDKDSRLRFTKVTSIGDDAKVHSISCGSFHMLALVSPVPKVLVPMACGRGDFGELGFNADSWDVAEEQERRIKAQVIARAHNAQFEQQVDTRYASDRVGQTNLAAAEHQQQQSRNDAVDTSVMGKPKFKPQPKYGKGASQQQLKRRDAFSRSSLSLIRLPPRVLPTAIEVSTASSGTVSASRGAEAAMFERDDPLTRIIQHATETQEPDLPDTIRAMHHRSAFRTSHTHTWYSFGCKYNFGIETNESSVPTPVTEAFEGLRDQQGSIAGVHAADEVFYAWTSTGQLFALGKGSLLPLGTEDAEATRFTPIDLDSAIGDDQWRVAEVMDVRGVNFVVVAAKLRKASNSTSAENAPTTSDEGGERLAYFVFGDNYYGQLGTGDEEPRLRPTLLPLPPHVKRILDVQPGARHLVVLAEEEVPM